MFGVVVCPRCRRAKGVDLRQKTTTCACGFAIRVTSSKVHARARTARELAPLVGEVSAELAGGTAVVRKALAAPRRTPPRGVHARIIAAIPSDADRSTKIRAAAAELTNELEVFTERDWSKVLDGLGIADAEGLLQILLHSNVVFEPREGFYRAVDLNP